ncbi:OtnA protein (fragment) [Vibrio nigripulchritudo SFn118]
MTFSDVRDFLNQRVKEQMIGVRSDISLGEMHTMQVFVMGDAYKPGAYTVSALTTISQAIYYSGGFSESGALRNVQLKRNSQVIRKLDMYDLLLKGDVRHPGYIEWKSGLRIADLFQSVDTSFNSTADVSYAVVVREINPQRDIEVYQVSLANAILSPTSKDNLKLNSRDRVLVFNRFNNEDLDTLADQETVTKAKTLEQAQLQAQQEQLKEQEVMSSSVAVSSATPLEKGSKQSKIVFRGKEITKDDFEALKQNTRRTLLAPVLLQLQQQSRLGLAPQIAEVFGEVKHPGRYPITPRMTISTLIEAAGGLTYNAFTINAELARTVINSKDERASIDVERIDLRQAIQGSTAADAIIVGRDRLNILEKPNVKLQSTVTLQGEVRFPGTYTVRQGETLGELLERAGGLTEFAHPQGAIFTREALRLQEQKLLNQYAADMRAETAKKTFRADSNMGSVISDPDKTLKFVEEASRSKALGRMVVQLNRILKDQRSADFMLEDGDFLFVPTFRNTVSIMGEVQVPITYLLDNKLDVDDYLNKAGGAKKQADEDRIFVVRADGSVYKPTSGYWFGNNHEELKAGDTIVVPIDTDYRDALSTWTAATQILYQTGVAINALK